MNTLLASLRIALLVAVANFACVHLHASEPGAVDFSHFKPSRGAEHVQIDVGAGLLKFASKVSRFHEPAAADILKGLKRVRVNVIGIDAADRDETHRKVDTLRADLDRTGWERIVTVQGERQEDIAIFVKTSGEDLLDGIVVTVLNPNREVVLINVVGTIKADDLATVIDRLEVNSLKGTRVVRRD